MMRLCDHFGDDHIESGHDYLVGLVASHVVEVIAHLLYQYFSVVDLGVQAAGVAIEEVQVGYYSVTLLLTLPNTTEGQAFDHFVLESLVLDKHCKEEVLTTPSVGLLHVVGNALPPLGVAFNPVEYLLRMLSK